MLKKRISDEEILNFIEEKNGATYKEMIEWSGYSRISLLKKMRAFLDEGLVYKKEPYPLIRFFRKNG
jgi:hypothetical protein